MYIYFTYILQQLSAYVEFLATHAEGQGGKVDISYHNRS